MHHYLDLVLCQVRPISLCCDNNKNLHRSTEERIPNSTHIQDQRSKRWKHTENFDLSQEAEKRLNLRLDSICDGNEKRLGTDKSHDLGTSTSNMMLSSHFGIKFYSSNNMGEMRCDSLKSPDSNLTAYHDGCGQPQQKKQSRP